MQVFGQLFRYFPPIFYAFYTKNVYFSSKSVEDEWKIISLLLHLPLY